jgi:hypothetical protein
LTNTVDVIDLVLDVQSDPEVTLTLDLNSALIFQNPSFEVGMFYSELLPPNYTLFMYKFKSDVTIQADRCDGFCITPATSTTTLTILKNGLTAGTITYNAGQYEPIFDLTFTNYSNDDIIQVISPQSPDETLAGVGLTISGIRI